MINDNWQDRLAALRASMPADEQPETDIPAATDTPGPQQKGALEIAFERKGRAGKTATIIAGFTLGDDEVADIAARIKRALGTGGSARGGEILIQGDRRSDVAAWLRKQGFKVKGNL